MPDWKQHVRAALPSPAAASPRDDEIIEELAQYLEDCYSAALAEGLSEEEATAACLAEFADSAELEREIRRALTPSLPARVKHLPHAAVPVPAGLERSGNMLADLRQDLHYALRMLVRQPVFTLIAVITLALGIGANTAVFSFINTLFLRPLAVHEPEQVVRLYATGEMNSRFDVFSYPNYLDLRDRSQSFAALAAHQRVSVSFSADPVSENLQGELVTGNYFTVMASKAELGRTLLPGDDEAPGASPVIVISQGMWQRRFGSAPDAVGMSVYLNGHPFTVVGVMPSSFKGSYEAMTAEFWAPMMMYQQVRPRGTEITNRGWGWLSGTGRLKPEVSVEQAREELALLSAQLRQDHPNMNAQVGFELYQASPLPESFNESVARILQFILAIVSLVLLVTCANIASILLARLTARRREIAVRQSLGAGRSRLVRQWLTESLLLAFFGGAAGLALAWWLQGAMLTLLPPDFSEFALAPQLDWRVLAFALATVLGTGIIFGLAPALRAGRTEVVTALKEGGGGTAGSTHRSRLFGFLIVFQVAASLVILVVAGLLLRSLNKIDSFDPGFNPHDILLTNIDLRRHRYNEAQGRVFYQQLTERLKRLPGAQSVTFATTVPLGFNRDRFGVHIDGHQPPPGRTTFPIDYNIVGPDYFATMGIPIQQGRAIEERDGAAGAKPVAVINATMARRFWPHEEAVGKGFQLGTRGPRIEVVGVARDSKYYSLNEEPRSFIYGSFGSSYSPSVTFHVRVASKPESLTRALQREVEAIDPKVASFDTQTFDELRKGPLFPSRVMALVSGLFGALAAVLAALGLYGVISYSVSQRTHELGVRIALGARRHDILRLVLGHGMLLAGAGVVVGVGAAFAVTRFLSSLLFGVTPTDPLTFVSMAVLLIAVALAACYLPARRATRVDPMVALRYD